MIPVVNAAFSVETFLDGTRTDEERMSAMMHKGEFLVAEDDNGRIIASVYVEVNGERGYLGMLAVEPSRQGGGLGRQMADAVEEYSRHKGCKYLDITVLSLRAELLPLYRKLGFVTTGTEDFHPTRRLKPGVACHAIKMSKALNAE